MNSVCLAWESANADGALNTELQSTYNEIKRICLPDYSGAANELTTFKEHGSTSMFEIGNTDIGHRCVDQLYFLRLT